MTLRTESIAKCAIFPVRHTITRSPPIRNLMSGTSGLTRRRSRLGAGRGSRRPTPSGRRCSAARIPEDGAAHADSQAAEGGGTRSSIHQVRIHDGPAVRGPYLAPDSVEFDAVILDEASQVQTMDAYGSILRARQIVVEGDHQQLPPTDHFKRTTSMFHFNAAIGAFAGSIADLGIDRAIFRRLIILSRICEDSHMRDKMERSSYVTDLLTGPSCVPLCGYS